jgi:hypothetical protein
MHPAHKVEPPKGDRGAVVTYTAADRAHRHDGVTQAAIAARLAALKGYHFAGASVRGDFRSLPDCGTLPGTGDRIDQDCSGTAVCPASPALKTASNGASA